MATLLLLSFLSLASGAQLLNVSVDCGTIQGPLYQFWRSVGYTPATYALRPDELENTAVIGSVPRRGVTQVRIHYMMDLIEILGYYNTTTTPSGYGLSYNFGPLNFALDTLIASNLSPGFEFMGSPVGFPTLPFSFYNPYDGNGHIYASQTLGMWRQMVADTLVHCIQRYGGDEVSTWHLETWNEPDEGWGWPKPPPPEAVSGFVSYFDATGAGVEDAEGLTGVKLYLGGTASGQAAKDKNYLPAIMDHMAQGLNQFTGAPVRWDYISAHVKGQSTSFVTVQGEWEVSALIRSNPTWAAPGAGIVTLPISNDEGDPMVGWEVPEDWRGDARYGSIIPKMVSQHLLSIYDNATTNNPLGWLSFDGAFMNGVGDNYTGFGERTMTARFGLPPATSTPFAFVRKNGLLAFSLLSRLPTATRCSSSSPSPSSSSSSIGSGGGDVLSSPTGVLASMDSVSGDVGVLVYNSPDCADGSVNPSVTPQITLSGLPWAPGTLDAVAVPYLLNDDPSISTYAAWQQAGSPAIPSGEVLQELWRVGAAGGAAASPPIPITLAPCGGGGGGGGGNTSCVTLPPPTPPTSPDLPSPGVVMWHLAVKGGASQSGPPPPPALLPYVKPPQLSLLPPGTAEVFLKWDCVQAPRSLYFYVIQVSSGGEEGPWTVANPPPFPKDTLCSFNHASADTPPGTQLWYRVAGVDYWGRQGPFSNATLALPWPVYV